MSFSRQIAQIDEKLHKFREKFLCILRIDKPRKKWYNKILSQILPALLRAPAVERGNAHLNTTSLMNFLGLLGFSNISSVHLQGFSFTL